MSTASRTINWSRYRSEFPVTKRYIYFNHAAVSPLSTRVLKAINEVSESFLTKGILCEEEVFERVAAVESDAAAAVDLSRNCAAAELRQVRVIEAPVEAVLAAIRRHRLAPDVVVLDPPRAGLGPRASQQLARLPAQRIVYVSCDPATLARDLRVLTEKRWSLARVIGFDLFPQTPHVEAVAVLTRAGATSSG